ncbi:TPA: hypothetical protein ACS78B_000171 [Providencia alcalifaciens]|uniref:hypothetical protein n=1 Tax=Providencia alcalifaciens TaxID=126385 RepID=UPI0012B54674|nr:hypothetical protein [Providencia alcalifaciens]MTC37618.1 hypothetical protein [Providencia alcalifaciens]CAG9424618.1 hypothetical protein NVI2019_NGLDDFDA_02404 [Providencia alcalifaciens]
MDLLEVFKYFIPLIGGVIVWSINRKRNSQLSKLTLLKESKSLISKRKFKCLQEKISNEILSSEIKIKNDDYFEMGIFLIKNKIIDAIHFRVLKHYLIIKNNKVKFKIDSMYTVDLWIGRIMAFIFIILFCLYAYFSFMAFDVLMLTISAKSIFLMVVDLSKFGALFIADIFLLLLANYFLKQNLKIKDVVFINVHLKKLDIPPKLYMDLNLALKRKRLTRNKALNKVKSMILPLR